MVYVSAYSECNKAFRARGKGLLSPYAFPRW